MGQYHHPVCIEAEEGLDPAGMDSGLKEGEQGFNRPSTPAAIVALVCARGGNMPADCSQSPLIGRWAGKRILIQGDYAQDNDIPGWKGPRLSKLYRAMTPVEQRKPKKNWRTMPVFADITRDACDLEYLKRCGMQPVDVQRPPRSGDWHGFLPEEIPEGQTRAIVNLDTFEYLNPVKFGQAPTLAGMVTLAPKDRNLPILKKANQDHLQIVDVAGGLFVMLCHPERRGGGDIPANGNILIAAVGAGDSRAKAAKLFSGVEDVKGRWRGGRILGTSEIRYEDWPTTEEVLETGTDISDKVVRYLVAISHY